MSPIRLSSELVEIGELTYIAARRRVDGGGTQGTRVPILRATASGLPERLPSVVLTSDLQGRLDGDGILAGVALVSIMESLALQNLVPPLASMGVVFAGDLFAEPLRGRARNGDARPVWRAWSAVARFVVGVAGNHDHLGESGDFASDYCQFASEEAGSLLHGDVVEHGGLRIGGVSGVVGQEGRYARSSEEEFARVLRRALREKPDLLVMHEGPDDPDRGQLGNPEVRRVVAEARVPLVVCGHRHWDTPVAALTDHTHVINVDNRVVVLVAEHAEVAPW